MAPQSLPGQPGTEPSLSSEPGSSSSPLPHSGCSCPRYCGSCRLFLGFFALSLSLHLVTICCYLELRSELRRDHNPGNIASSRDSGPGTSDAHGGLSQVGRNALRLSDLQLQATSPLHQVALLNSLRTEDSSHLEAENRHFRRTKRNKGSDGSEMYSRYEEAFWVKLCVWRVNYNIIKKEETHVTVSLLELQRN